MNHRSDQIDQFLEEYRVALQDAARLSAEEKNLDEQRKIVRSELVTKFEGPATKAEHFAQASTEYRQAAARLMEARSLAASANAKVDWMTARLDIWRTRSANLRTKQRGE